MERDPQGPLRLSTWSAARRVKAIPGRPRPAIRSRIWVGDRVDLGAAGLKGEAGAAGLGGKAIGVISRATGRVG